MQHRSYSTLPLSLGLTLILAFGPACNDEEEVLQPLPPATLSGFVVDAGGTAVPGAFINFEYTVRFNGSIVWPEQVYNLASAQAESVVEIHDHLGKLIRTLDADGNELVWDGTDAAGDPVPDGPYLYRLTTSDSVFEKWFILVQGSLNFRSRTSVTETDQDGRYSISLVDLPLWESYAGAIADDLDPESGEFVFGPEVTVYAFLGDGTTIHGRKDLQIASPAIPLTADLTID